MNTLRVAMPPGLDWQPVAVLVLLLAGALAVGDYPLQIATARLSLLALSLVGDASLSGTLLQVGGIEVAVTPDCSGMNTLLALAPCAVGWALLANRSSFVTGVLLVPVLLLANTLRVLLITLLALTGGYELAMGPLHDSSGLLVFLVSLFGVMFLQERLQQHGRQLVQFLPSILAITLLVGICANLVITALQSPVDRTLLPMAFLGVAMLAAPLLFLQPALKRSLAYPAVLLILALVLDVGGLVHLGAVLTLYMLLRRPSGARIQDVGLMLLLVTVPGLQLAIATTTGVSTVLIATFSVVGAFVLGYLSTALRPWIDRRPLLAVSTLLTLAFGSLLLAVLSAPVLRMTTSVPGYVVGDWVGRDIPLTVSERNLFGESGVVKREYRQGDKKLWLFRLATGDRRRIHPPQYCYLSGGWRVTDGEGEAGTGRFLVDHPTGDVRDVRFWYEHGGRAFTSRLLLIASTVMQIPGSGTTWTMTRVSAPETTTDDEIEAFIGLISDW